MPRPVTRTSAVLVALALAFPATGLAQGAGDQQYSDPFTESEGGSGGDSGSGGGNSGSGGGGNSGSGNSGNSGSGSPTPSQTPSGSGSTTGQAPQATATPQTGEQLPRTGYPAWLAALAGGMLLASGATLRVSLGLRR